MKFGVVVIAILAGFVLSGALVTAFDYSQVQRATSLTDAKEKVAFARVGAEQLWENLEYFLRIRLFQWTMLVGLLLFVKPSEMAAALRLAFQLALSL